MEYAAHDPEHSFVIGDAPVVTWEGLDNNVLLYGQGFSRPNFEVVPPVTPTTCLHILPAVHRNRPTRIPTTQEVNRAQASFSTNYCYGNVNDPALNQFLQPHFGRSKLGINAFSVRHRNYEDTLFELLMSGGENFVAPTLPSNRSERSLSLS